MTNAVLSAVVDRAGRVALGCEPGPPATDDHLLTRFARARDEVAFRELVRRHGPMVLGVCRRVTGHTQDAEDAFQAAFLVLARRAAAVRPGGAVRAWLYGVAVRVAREARAVSLRRQARESPVPDVPDRPAPVAEDNRDALAVLDQEIAALPDHLRAAVVACELDGLSRRDGATRLGIPEGTLSSRLAKARGILADRLRDRGVAAPACVSAALTAVAVPAALAARTTAVVTLGAVPAAVAALAQRAGKGLLLLKLRSLAPAAVVLAAVLAAAAVSEAAPSQPPAPDTIVRLVKQGPARQPAPGPAAQPREGEVLVWRKGHAALLKPDGTTVRGWKGDDVPEPGAARLSPDGQTIAVLRAYETRTRKQPVDVGGGAKLPGTLSRHLYRVTLYPVADELVGTDVLLPGDSAESVVWSADGAKLYAGTHADDPDYSHDNDLAHFVIDVATRRHAPLKLPAGHHLKDVSPDEKTFLTIGPRPNPATVRPAFLVPAGGGEPVAITEPGEVLYDGQFSPDGRRLVLCGIRSVRAAAGPAGNPAAGSPAIGAPDYWLESATTDAPGRRTPLALRDCQYANQCRSSPDGKRVVSFRAVIPPLNQPAPPREVVVSDADGRNPRTIFTDPERLAPVFVDWR